MEPGKTVELDAGIINESTQGYCTIAGHKAQGMVLQINTTDDAHVWDVAAEGPDPEIPVISIADLGILRDARLEDDTAVVKYCRSAVDTVVICSMGTCSSFL